MKSNGQRLHKHVIGLFATLASIALIIGTAYSAFAVGTPKRVTVLYTNDTLGNFEPCG